MIVHFPIALFLTSIVFDLLGIRFNRESLREGAVWLLGLGLLAGIASFISGEQAEEIAELAGIPESVIEMHENLATLTMGMWGFLFIWRFFFKTRSTERLMSPYFLVALIAIGTLFATGHYGGDLVFEHGAGVKVIKQSSSPDLHDEHDDD